MEVMFDYTKLRSRIKEVLGTQDQYAKALGLGRVSVSQSLNNQREFSAGEMLRTAQVLHFSVSEIPDYFFNQEVQKHEQRAPGTKEPSAAGPGA